MTGLHLSTKDRHGSQGGTGAKDERFAKVDEVDDRRKGKFEKVTSSSQPCQESGMTVRVIRGNVEYGMLQSAYD